MPIEINRIPHSVLRHFRARSAVIVAQGENDLFSHSQENSRATPREVLIATSGSSTEQIDPQKLAPSTELDLSALEELRSQEGVYSVTMVISKLDEDLMLEATRALIKRYLVLSELRTLEEFTQTAYVAYVVTHYNPRQRPLGPLTINIGGDCYRTGHQIRDLSSILNRTRDLAEAMLKKAVMIFPDIPALHGGKKGEWIILDEEGRKIDGLSEEAIIALGSAIIPRGIRFLNRFKELRAQEAGIYPSFPDRNYVLPDSGSPDVLSGSFWRGEYPDKYINMCEAWEARGIDMRNFTCLPTNLAGTKDSSARPTGYGVATTTMALADLYAKRSGKTRGELRFLLEAAGGVGRNTIEALINEYKIRPNKITVFDRSIAACSSVKDKYGVNTVSMRHSDFYEQRLSQDRQADISYDVWINNGEGNNTRPEHVRELLASGIRVFAGGANNFLQVGTEKESLDGIFEAGGLAWPDAATSGGGWTLAVIDIMTRCQGKSSSSDEIQRRILSIVKQRNEQLVRDVLSSLPDGAPGDEIWARVDSLMEERKAKTLAMQLSPEEIFAAADSTTWNLS